MPRPKSIIAFEQCYLGSLVLGFIALAFGWGAQKALLARNPDVAQLNSGMLYASLFGGLILGAVITILLWYFAARRASVVAKWIIVVFFAFGVLVLLSSLAKGTVAPGLGGVISIANTVLQAVAVWMLFKPDSKAWFADGRATNLDDTFR